MSTPLRSRRATSVLVSALAACAGLALLHAPLADARPAGGHEQHGHHGGHDRPGHGGGHGQPAPDPARTQLVGFASLPADTFVPGSEPSGAFTTNPGVPFPGQPVQGFSAVHALGGGDYLVMSDNGFGTKANSQDFQLRVHRIHPDLAGRTIAVRGGGFVLSDPDRLVPFTTWRDGGCQAATSLPAGYACPARDRILTGWDFDIESMQVADDGTFWFGEEFGPFLLHSDARGRLLDAPVPTPGVKSPSNPTLVAGEQPGVADSKGFEGMALSPDQRYLYPVLEGATAQDIAAGLPNDRRIYQVAVARGRGPATFTGKQWRYRMELPGDSVGDFIAVDDHRFLMIERDNGSGPTAQLKRIYLVDTRDRDHDGYVDKTLLVDLLAVPDPRRLGGTGATFSFPYVTIEDVEILDDRTIAVLNDNNYPGTGGRGAGVKDIDEFLQIRLDQPLDADRRVLARR